MLEDLPPIALTDAHVAALEHAIRAEGYSIMMNDETGEIRLERTQESVAAAIAMMEQPSADDPESCLGCDRTLAEGERGVCAACYPHYSAG